MNLRHPVIRQHSGGASVRFSGWMAATSIILTIVCSPAVFAADAILSWSPNTETNLAGYRVYYGTSSRSYPNVIDVGLVTTYTVTGLGPGTYFFALTAYNTAGAESGVSNEASKVIPDTQPPVISAVTVGGITSAQATVSWTTNEPATSLVEYGTTTTYGLQTTENLALAGQHQHQLTGLQASTTYHYRVLSRDAAGNLATSADRTFTTLAAADTTAPTISAVAAGSVTSSGATITWTTNEGSTTQVQYGPTSAYGATTSLNSTLVTAHSQGLTGLTATHYHYRVLSRDAAGNLAMSADLTFTTLAAADTTAPTLSAVAAGSVTSSGATITWTTNEGSTTQVQYGPTSAYGATTSLNSTLVTTHSHYRVLSRDAAGNLAASPDFSFNMPAAADSTVPVISAVAAGNVSSSGATITWTTNEPATTQVTYGTTTAYGSSTPLNATLVTGHNQTLTGLAAATVYHFRVISRDAAGNQAISGDLTFTTLAAPTPSSDTTPPTISWIHAWAPTATSAVVEWWTNEPATSVVQYGTTTAYGSSSPVDSALVQFHRQGLTGLRPATMYHFRVISRDAAGNSRASPDQTFRTPS